MIFIIRYLYMMTTVTGESFLMWRAVTLKEIA